MRSLLLVAVEKNWLHKLNKNNPPGQQGSIKPYIFPEMSTGEAVEAKREAVKNTVFERSFSDGNGELSGNLMPRREVTGEMEDDVITIEEQAYIKGFEKGEKEGLESARQRVGSLLGSFKEALLELDSLKKDLLLNSERESVELSLAVAKKIVCQEIATNRDVVLNVVKEALKKVVGNENIRVRMCPDDLNIMNEFKSQLPELMEDFNKVSFEGDESITQGGCIIDTNQGDIDARIEKQLKTVEDVFYAEIKKLNID